VFDNLGGEGITRWQFFCCWSLSSSSSADRHFFGGVGIVFVLFAAVLALVYFVGLTVEGFLIGIVALMAGLLVFTFVSNGRKKG
jgi:hypothetical protein